jgi:hypothetical protein
MAKTKKASTRRLIVKRATVKDLRPRSTIKGGLKAPKKA